MSFTYGDHEKSSLYSIRLKGIFVFFFFITFTLSNFQMSLLKINRGNFKGSVLFCMTVFFVCLFVCLVMPSFSFYVRHLLPLRRGKVGQSIKHITYFYVARGNPQGEPVNMAGFNDANEALSWFNSFKSIIVIITIVLFFQNYMRN